MNEDAAPPAPIGPASAAPDGARPGGRDPWEAEPSFVRPERSDTLVVDVDGFEGPLDLLLALARTQKVDLARISILALAEQYLDFIDRVLKTRLELAADYLVMAAWLAYLKSRLLLPAAPADAEPSGADLAAELAFRLRRLEAMREAGAALMTRNRLGRDVFARGAPEPMAVVVRPRYEASLFDLLTAYAGQRQRHMIGSVRVAVRSVWSLSEAREILERLVGRVGDWTPFQNFLGVYMSPSMRATVLASSFSASLEMVREGKIEMKQTGPFAPLYLRRREEPQLFEDVPADPPRDAGA
jgi:segregation and condensation protein A